MPDQVNTAAEADLIEALRRIARGRVDNGLPLNRHDAREIARRALIAAGVSWLKPKREIAS